MSLFYSVPIALGSILIVVTFLFEVIHFIHGKVFYSQLIKDLIASRISSIKNKDLDYAGSGFFSKNPCIIFYLSFAYEGKYYNIARFSKLSRLISQKLKLIKQKERDEFNAVCQKEITNQREQNLKNLMKKAAELKELAEEVLYWGK